MSLEAYNFYEELFRVVTTSEVTEEGVYGEDQTPSGLISSMIKVEVVHLVALISADGGVNVMKFYCDPPKNSDGEEMGDVVLDDQVIVKGKEGADPIVAKLKLNNRLDADRKRMGDEMMALILEKTGKAAYYG